MENVSVKNTTAGLRTFFNFFLILSFDFYISYYSTRSGLPGFYFPLLEYS